MSDIGPWEIGNSGNAQGDRDAAVTRGLRANGYLSDWPLNWPRWALHSFFAVPAANEVLAVQVVAELGRDAQDAVESAFALGGYAAVEGLVGGFLAERRAQG